MKTKNTSKYKWIKLAIVVWTLVFVCAITVMADTQTSDYSGIQLTASSSGRVEITSATTGTGWTVKAYGTDGSCNSTNTETVTFTIKNTDTARAVTFDISVTSTDASPSGAPSGSQSLAANGSLTSFTATSGNGASAYTTINIYISNVTLESTGAKVITTVIPKTGGMITVDGDAVTTQRDFENTDDHVYSLTATAATGYTFYGWMSADGLLSLTKNEDGTYSYAGQNAATLWPVFVKSGSAMYRIKDTSKYYAHLDEAITAAGSSGTILVCQSGTAYHSTGGTEFTIPSGVTLLLPYSDSDLTVQSGLTSSASYLANGNYAFNASGGEQSTTSGLLYTLTIPEGTTLTVANGTAATVGNCGRIVVGGKVASGNGSTIRNGATYKDHSNLVVNGTLNLGNYAVLATTGYILGDGNILAEGTGAQIFQPYVCMDFPGAAVSALAMRKGGVDGSTQPSGETAVSPYIYWGVVNIQAKLTLKSGNFMYAYATLGDDSKPYHTNAVLVGNSSTPGLLTLDSGATFYNEFESIKWSGYSYGLLGRNQIRIEGGASLGSLQLSLNAGGFSGDIDTASVVCPIGYNMDITLDGQYDYYIDKSMMLLPGARLTVTKDATLTIGSKATSTIRFAVWDGLIHRGYRNSGSLFGSVSEYQVEAATTRNNSVNYPTNIELDKGGLSEDADFVINGTLVIGANVAIGGMIQTDGDGRVEVNSSATLSVKVQPNILDAQSFNLYPRYMASMSMFDSQAKLNINGTLTQIKPGITYVGTANTSLTNAGFTNIYYPGFDSSGNRVAATDLAITYNSAETIKGLWMCETHNTENYITEDGTPATCTDPGTTDKITCGDCWAVVQESTVIPATGHTDTQTSSQEGFLACDGCGAMLFRLVSMSAYADARTELVLEFEVNSELADEDYITVSFDGKAGSENKDAEIIVEGTTVTVMQPVASGLMTENVVVSITDGTNPAYVVGTSDTTISRSVVDYARLVLQQKDSQFDAAKELVTAMVIYGGYAQKLFNEDADNPAYNVLTDFLTAEEIKQLHDKVSGVLSADIGMTLYDADTLPTGFLTGDNVKPVTQNVVLDSAIEQTVYFYLEDNFDLSDTVELSYITNVGGTSKHTTLTPVYDEENSRYYIIIKNIPAALLNYDYTITGTVNDESFTITPSIASYIQRVIERNGDIGITDETDETKAARMSLVKAMWLYNQVACTFFSQETVTEVSQ